MDIPRNNKNPISFSNFWKERTDCRTHSYHGHRGIKLALFLDYNSHRWGLPRFTINTMIYFPSEMGFKRGPMCPSM